MRSTTLVVAAVICAALSGAPQISPATPSRIATVLRASLLMAAVAAIFTAVAILPAYVRLVRRLRAHGHDTPGFGGMPPSSFLPHAVIAIVIGGSLATIALGRDYWPFSPYAMYAEPKRWEPLSVISAYGVAEDIEIPLRYSGYLDPFDATRVWVTTHGALRRGHRPAAIARFYLNIYERRRALHDGPALRALRLYRETWVPDQSGPPIRELLCEELR